MIHSYFNLFAYKDLLDGMAWYLPYCSYLKFLGNCGRLLFESQSESPLGLWYKSIWDLLLLIFGWVDV